MGNSIAAKVLRNSGQWLLKQSGTEVRDPALMDDPVFTELYARCEPFTMTSRERLFALYSACMHIVDAKIEGAFVECGVWKGGSAMMMAACLKHRGITDRDLYLFDTFEGMSKPEDIDRTFTGEQASGTFEKTAIAEDASDWCRSPFEEVVNNLRSTGYPAERIHLVKGKVEDTLPASLPEQPIAMLRLDTDWYSSTRHELVHLYPKLVQHGVLIIDDFGHWEGARKAVLEYFSEHGVHMLLNRIDYTGRIGIKTEGPMG